MGILHSEAREITRRAYRRLFGHEPTEGEVDFATAVALAETGYGRASGQFARFAADGDINWGALESGTPDTDIDTTFQRFVQLGLHPSKREGQDAGRRVFFYVFPTDEEAAVALLRTWGAPDTLAAAATGSAVAVASAMKNHGYYEGFHVGPGGLQGGKRSPPFKEVSSDAEARELNVRDYASFLTGSLNRIRGGGEQPGPPPIVEPSVLPRLPSLTLGNVAIALGIGACGYVLLTRTATGRRLADRATRNVSALGQRIGVTTYLRRARVNALALREAIVR